MIDALEIWEKIRSWDSCKEAIAFYEAQHFSKKQILDQGSVDFDKLVLEDKEEDSRFRALYYASRNGYMNMHIKQNRTAMRRYLKNIDASRNILLIDFGCGPMTAGLVFAELLSKIKPNYKETVFYLGIDASKNMCELSRKINKKYELFDEKHFQIVNGTELYSPPETEMPFHIAILCFSYVLSPRTLKTDLNLNYNADKQKSMMEDFAKKWHVYAQNHQETYAIYGNPHGGHFESNWTIFSNDIAKLSERDQISYTNSGLNDCDWGSEKPSIMACIKSERRE